MSGWIYVEIRKKDKYNRTFFGIFAYSIKNA